MAGEQMARLATLLEPLGPQLDDDIAERCFAIIGARLVEIAPSLSSASCSLLLEQLRKGQGVGTWAVGRERLRRALERSIEAAAGSRRSRSQRCSSRSRSGGRSRG